MLDMRHSEEELARQTLENLASGIDTDIGRNVELYDLLTDPKEAANLAEKEPETTTRLRQAALDWRKSLPVRPKTPAPPRSMP